MWSIRRHRYRYLLGRELGVEFTVASQENQSAGCFEIAAALARFRTICCFHGTVSGVKVPLHSTGQNQLLEDNGPGKEIERPEAAETRLGHDPGAADRLENPARTREPAVNGVDQYLSPLKNKVNEYHGTTFKSNDSFAIMPH